MDDNKGTTHRNNQRLGYRQELSNFELDCLMELEQTQQQLHSSASINNAISHNPNINTSNNNNNNIGPNSNNNNNTTNTTISETCFEENGDNFWDTFESCAQAVAMLYRNTHWRTFQSAAAATTQLYKDGVEARRRSYEQGASAGRQRLLKELIGYFRCSHAKTFVRREDLLAFLAGRSPPTRHANVHQTNANNQTSPRGIQSTLLGHMEQQDDPLYMFHEALALQSGGNSPASLRNSPPRRPAIRQQELGAFLLDEARRRNTRKRNSTGSCSVGSPSAVHKRPRRYF